MKIKKYKVILTMTTEILGSQPTIDVASEYIAKSNDMELPGDEASTLPEVLERGTTVFHKLDGKPILFDYAVKGFIKESARVQNGKVTGGVKNLRSKVVQLVFVRPRMITLNIPAEYKDSPNGGITYNERPLRAETAQGPRVALARSEQLPIGTTLEFTLEVLPGEISEKVLCDLFDYGQYSGLGQWRGGSHGSFTYSLEEIE